MSIKPQTSTGTATGAPRRSCNELGLCQVSIRRQLNMPPVEPCAECECRAERIDTRRTPPGGFHFAPGVIDKPEKPMAGKDLRLAVLLVLAAMALSLFVGMASGYVHG